MNGISLIIQNADFSGSPLGAVTFVESAKEIVDSYLAKVGASMEKELALINLYTRLTELDVIGSVDVFPMLGNTLSNRTKGIKPQGSEYLFNSLFVGDNASQGTVGGITFADSNPNISGTEEGYSTKLLNDINNFFAFMKVTPYRLGQGWSSRYDLGQAGLGGNFDILLESVQGQDTQYHEALHLRQVGKAETKVLGLYDTIKLNSSSLYFMQYNEGYKTYLGNDHELFHTSEGITTPLPYPFIVNNAIGGCVNNPGSHYFNAYVEMFAIGTVPTNKFQDVCDAFVEYFA